MKIDIIVVYMPRYNKGHEMNFVPPITGIHLAALTPPQHQVRVIHQQLPGQPVIYLADQAHVPYGPRPLAEVRSFSEAITRCLLDGGARLIVVACNTASAAALRHLREIFPGVPFVGMEPAVKPAVESTRTGMVGVLATPATFQGALYASVVERFANGVTLLQHTCPGLVSQIEAGDLDGDQTRAILTEALQPMLARGIPLIEQIAGPGVRVIDPAPAVARQTGRLLDSFGLRPAGLPPVPARRYLTTGDPGLLQRLLPRLIGESGRVEGLHWRADLRLVSSSA